MSVKNSLNLPSSTAIRLRYLTQKIHGLGVCPTYELLAEFVANSSDPIAPMQRIEAFGAIHRDLLGVYGGRDLPPVVRLVK